MSRGKFRAFVRSLGVLWGQNRIQCGSACRRRGERRTAHFKASGSLTVCEALLSGLLVVGGACIDPKCPMGYWQDGDRCYRIKDAEAADGATFESEAGVVLANDASPGRTAQAEADSAADAQDLRAEHDASGAHDASEAGDAAMDGDTCSGTECPECDYGNPCEGTHELCVGNKCVVQPHCGDGKKGADEDCDPMHPSWNPWTCTSACKVVTTYTACGGNPAEPQGGCAVGETCMLGACYSRCNVPGDCPAPPPGTAAKPICYKDVLGNCMLTGCQAASDCPPGLVCVYSAAPTVQANMCIQCGIEDACTSGLTCGLASSGDMYKRCQ